MVRGLAGQRRRWFRTRPPRPRRTARAVSSAARWACTSTAGAVPTMRTIKNFDWDVAPLPRGSQSASILHSDGYCMAGKSKDKEAAWKFIEYANSVTGQEIVARSGRTVPSLRMVAESASFLDPAKTGSQPGLA
ncbi:extracellular solute-binding protein [Candidatus Amarolinea dominans]|uniref:extracellular solute-binding protein n=1 Tax=Candidatus Amarolinea dominans TaxID=3140696 RepID=UPI0031CCA5FC